ncbi:MAG: 50S ribosomal protein L32, partial [Candidatus Doudnabacteria bacterium CG10_big_fil_rev_8_21_14_0_10_41_10]
THSRTNSRRSHHALKAMAISSCSNCGAGVHPHQVCKDCGYYKGKQVLTPRVKKKKAKK